MYIVAQTDLKISMHKAKSLVYIKYFLNIGYAQAYN